MNYLLDILIFGSGVFLVIFATFAPDRRPQKPKPKPNPNDIFEIFKQNPLNWIPTTLTLSIAALTISMGLIFAETGETIMGYPLVLIGLLFTIAEITSRLKNFKKDSFRPFSGFLIPAIVLLYFGFIRTHDIWIADQRTGYCLGIFGVCSAILDLTLKLKNRHAKVN